MKYNAVDLFHIQPQISIVILPVWLTQYTTESHIHKALVCRYTCLGASPAEALALTATLYKHAVYCVNLRRRFKLNARHCF
jgi:hypothetical protein